MVRCVILRILACGLLAASAGGLTTRKHPSSSSHCCSRTAVFSLASDQSASSYRDLDVWNEDCSRRRILDGVVIASAATAALWIPTTCSAEDSPPEIKKPFAPTEALLPAVRVKRVIDKSVQLVTELVERNDSSASLLLQVEALLLQQQNYMGSMANKNAVPEKPARQYLEAYDRNREKLSILEKPGAMIAQMGEIAEWKRLKRQEFSKEQGDEIRAALNLYTASLRFSADSYRLNVPKDLRSQMVRQDTLPDIKQVIASDMGLRYLYRNEILAALEDARSELRYLRLLQQKQQQEQQQDALFVDVRDLVHILKRAQDACDKWFGLIDTQDVKDALELAEQEERARA